MFEVEVNDTAVPGLARIAAGTRSPRPLMRMIAGTLGDITEGNFAAQGRPKWLGLAPGTIKARTKRGTWPGKILQASGRLAASIATDYGGDWSRVGSNAVYAAIHQNGGIIDRAALSSWGNLRMDRNGSLLRQGAKGRNKNLAVFAKAGHKRGKAIRYTVAAHQIKIPPRPYLPADTQSKLQPEAERAIRSDVQNYLRSLAD